MDSHENYLEIEIVLNKSEDRGKQIKSIFERFVSAEEILADIPKLKIEQELNLKDKKLDNIEGP